MQKHILLLTVILCHSLPTRLLAQSAVVHPLSLKSYVDTHPDETLQVIVTAVSGASAASIVGSPGIKSIQSNAVVLDSINAVAAPLLGSTISTIISNPKTESVWYEASQGIAFADYVRLISGIAYAVSNGADVLNISSAPTEGSFDQSEPLNRATKRAYEKGHLLILAAGNFGPQPGTLSRWCTDWVVCVGAANEDGSDLWRQSSRSGEDTGRLTIVASGIDILTTHPQGVLKTDQELADEKRVGFEHLVRPDEQGLYTIVTGTSFAAPEVSKIASLLIYFVDHQIMECRRDHVESFTIKYDIPLRRTPDDRTTTRRKSGTVVVQGSYRLATYPAIKSPDLLIQLLLDMAVGVKDYQSESIGAGFVSWDNAVHYFGRFGTPPPTLMPIKVTQ